MKYGSRNNFGAKESNHVIVMLMHCINITPISRCCPLEMEMINFIKQRSIVEVDQSSLSSMPKRYLSKETRGTSANVINQINQVSKALGTNQHS